MASPEEMTPSLPDTLPEDFGEWDGEGPAPPPHNTSEWDTAFDRGATTKPHGQSDDRDAFLASLMDKQRVSRSGSSAPGFAKQNDFVNWEREVPAAPVRGSSREWDTTNVRSETAKPQAIVRSEAAKPPANARSETAKPLETWPTLSEPVFAKPPKPASEADAAPRHAALRPEGSQAASEAPAAQSRPNAAPVDGVRPSRELTATEIRKADETLYQMFSSKHTEAKGERKTAKKKWVIFAAAGACAVLLPLVLVVSLGHHGAKAAAKPAVQTYSAATDTAAQTNGSSDIESSATGKPGAGKGQSDGSMPNDADASSGKALTEKQAKMMNQQLNAPRVISQDARKQMAENAPPPASLGADGLGGGGSMDSVFNGHTQSNVKVTSSRPLAVSSGVANGMLIQKSPPVYPPMAKTARVSGTVELHATISKNGTIKDLSVVSGPAMLRESAVDAVRNWRYRPYMLNDQPVEVETTISVVFSLGN